MDPWKRTRTARTDDQSSTVAEKAITHYGLTKKADCQIFGPGTKHVVNLHIWPEWAVNNLPLFDLPLDAIDDPRNILRVHKKVERAFDSKELTFVMTGDVLTLKVLAPDLLSEVLDDTGMTFSDIDRRSLRFSSANAPFRRLLAAHSIAAHRFAELQNWIVGQDCTEGEVRAMDLARLSLGDSESLKKVAYFFRKENERTGVGTPPDRSDSPLATRALMTPVSATVLAKPSVASGRGRGKGRGGSCYMCNQRGHIKRDCPENPKNKQAGDGSPNV